VITSRTKVVLIRNYGYSERWSKFGMSKRSKFFELPKVLSNFLIWTRKKFDNITEMIKINRDKSLKIMIQSYTRFYEYKLARIKGKKKPINIQQ